MDHFCFVFCFSKQRPSGEKQIGVTTNQSRKIMKLSKEGSVNLYYYMEREKTNKVCVNKSNTQKNTNSESQQKI